jgi:hypothetical protein
MGARGGGGVAGNPWPASDSNVSERVYGRFGGDPHQSFLYCTLTLAIHFNGSNGTAYARPSMV